MLFLATFVPRERKGPIRRTSRSGAVEMGESNSPPLVHRCASMYATAPNFWVWYKGMCVGVRRCASVCLRFCQRWCHHGCHHGCHRGCHHGCHRGCHHGCHHGCQVGVPGERSRFTAVLTWLGRRGSATATLNCLVARP